MCDPQGQLADFIGGEWPARVRAAPICKFLVALRDCFKYHDYPKRLSTAVLLEWVQSLPDGSLEIDGPINARTWRRCSPSSASIPSCKRNGSGTTSPARGYQLHDFLEHWLLWLGFTVPGASPAARQPDDSGDESMPAPATREAAVAS
jgi:hypothetical protein